MKRILFLLLFSSAILSLSALEPMFRMEEGEMRLVVINMDKSELRKEGNFILYEPHRQVMSSTYETFYIPLEDFEAAFGRFRQISDSELTAGGYLIRLSTENFRPGDNLLPQPEGGFQIIPYIFLITSVE